MKIGIWIRVSTKEQKDGDSPETHRQIALDYCKRRDWPVEEIYDLSGVSGKSVLGHPEAKRMMADVQMGKIKGLVFTKIARLARNTRELLEISDYFQRHEAVLVSISEEIDPTTSTGRLFYSMMASMAQWEREEIASRVAASVPIRARMGKSTGGVGPFGYHWVDKKLVPHDDEALVVRRAFEIFCETKKFLTSCAKLNLEGFRARKSEWRTTTLKRMLTEQAYIGKRRANYSKSLGDGKSWKIKPKDEWVFTDVEPIISKDVWDATQLIIAGRNVKYPSRVPKEGKYIYSGLIICGLCHGKMYVQPYGGMASPRYVCKKCKNKIDENIITTYFKDGLEKMTTVPEFGKTNNREDDISDKGKRLQLMKKELSALRGKIDQILDMKFERTIDETGFQDRYVPLSKRRDQIGDEIPRLEEAIATAKSISENRVYLINAAKKLSDQWEILDEDEKGKMAKDLIQKVEVGDMTLEFTLYYLPEFSKLGNDDRTGRDSWRRPA